MSTQDNDILGDYSCGACGWTGYVDNCVWEEDIERYCCPNCGQDRCGGIDEEDFKEGNILHGRTWRGQKMN